MIRSLCFDGYRSFPCRRQYDRSQPFQRFDLAPLTLLIGRNNAGKTSVATLLHQVLAGMGGVDKNALSLAVGGEAVAECFQDLLPARDLTAFLELDVTADGLSGRHRLEVILYLPGLLDDDPRPRARSVRWDGVDYPGSDTPLEDGLIPNGAFGSTQVRDEAVKVWRSSVWLGPLRGTVPEIPFRHGRHPQNLPIGPRGEGVIDLLAEDGAVFNEVSSWLAQHAGLSLRWEKNLDLWRLQTVRGAARSVPITQVGTGVHQLLPVLTLAKWRRHHSDAITFLDVIQQPELHLHDALQPMLGDLFLDVARTGAGVTIVETHAEGLLLRVRRRIAEGEFPADRVALYYIDDSLQGSELRRIQILETGEVDDWPKGVFLESYEEVKALRRAQRGRGG
ncbi:MAG: hypothetical protein P9F75_15425 [Candidatus Contendobacter sp.]|nr:hypothetical protein [Candidatus Contendobacter sp.]